MEEVPFLRGFRSRKRTIQYLSHDKTKLKRARAWWGCDKKYWTYVTVHDVPPRPRNSPHSASPTFPQTFKQAIAMNLITLVPAVLLGLLSTYGASVSYRAVTRLRAYEETSEKAAEWSNTAAQRLYKTRTTQAGGAISVRPMSMSNLNPVSR
jgi:hypothetical protein